MGLFSELLVLGNKSASIKKKDMCKEIDLYLVTMDSFSDKDFERKLEQRRSNLKLKFYLLYPKNP